MSAPPERRRMWEKPRRPGELLRGSLRAPPGLEVAAERFPLPRPAGPLAWHPLLLASPGRAGMPDQRGDFPWDSLAPKQRQMLLSLRLCPPGEISALETQLPPLPPLPSPGLQSTRTLVGEPPSTQPCGGASIVLSRSLQKGGGQGEAELTPAPALPQGLGVPPRGRRRPRGDHL